MSAEQLLLKPPTRIRIRIRPSNAIYMPPSLAVRLVCLGPSIVFCSFFAFLPVSESAPAPVPCTFSALCVPCIFLHFWLLSVHLAGFAAHSSQLAAQRSSVSAPRSLYALFVLRDIYVCGIYHTHIFILTYILLFASTLPAAGILIRKTNILRNSRSSRAARAGLAQVSFMRFNAGI